MTSPAEALQAAIVERLKASDTFSRGVVGRIYNANSKELPCAWVGITQSDGPSDTIELLATAHIWKSGDEASVKELSESAQAILTEAPNAKGLSIKSWEHEYSEIRLDEETAAYRALVRCRGQA
ncbi:MAG: hypothetical protein QM744_16360 [Mesorhizobium sp.]